jgi:hypothetical protein
VARCSFALRGSCSQAHEQSTASIASLFDFEELLLEMRRDTGYPKTRLGRGDLLAHSLTISIGTLLNYKRAPPKITPAVAEMECH